MPSPFAEQHRAVIPVRETIYWTVSAPIHWKFPDGDHVKYTWDGTEMRTLCKTDLVRCCTEDEPCIDCAETED